MCNHQCRKKCLREACCGQQIRLLVETENFSLHSSELDTLITGTPPELASLCAVVHVSPNGRHLLNGLLHRSAMDRKRGDNDNMAITHKAKGVIF